MSNVKRAPYFKGEELNPYGNNNPTESGRVSSVGPVGKTSPKASGDVVKTSKSMSSPRVIPRG